MESQMRYSLQQQCNIKKLICIFEKYSLCGCSYDGDTLFGLSTAMIEKKDRHITLLGAAMRKTVALSIYRAICCAAQSSSKQNTLGRALPEETCIEIVGAEFLKHCGQEERNKADVNKDEL